MADRPILFSAPMVRALLAGTKTQTRRVLNPQPETFPLQNGEQCLVYPMHVEGESVPRIAMGDGRCGVITLQKVPFAVGDRLWVKETWTHTGTGVWAVGDVHRALDGRVAYRATEDIPGAGWFPSIFMFRKLSRLTLTVTDVRVERLQDISEADAIAEGVFRTRSPNAAGDGWEWDDPRDGYRNLWDSINGAGAWAENPWVVAVSFDVRQGNIDA
jgi:hypothetical protein